MGFDVQSSSTGYTPKHGMRKTRFYSIWRNMKNRCRYPNTRNYHNYGGRGITYDPRWEQFENFYADMHEEYSDKLSLERRDVNGNYNKENCVWVEPIMQYRNKRCNVKVTYNGEQYNLIDLYDKINPEMTYSLILNRVRHLGWSAEKALHTPVDKSRRNSLYKGD